MFIKPLQYTPLQSISSPPVPETKSTFRETLAQALGTVNQAMEKSDEADNAFMSGRAESIHEVQIAAVKADVLMKLTANLASKVAHCTTQLFQMQV
ncbi:MAG: flagellar hook-basal body complex protein FliE [Candidatus Eremiobacteraeota bacterium]|nr:flagellar hook-basal body complex protein FliE [Candidatus Eremiobacteraeota bacterium]